MLINLFFVVLKMYRTKLKKNENIFRQAIITHIFQNYIKSLKIVMCNNIMKNVRYAQM